MNPMMAAINKRKSSGGLMGDHGATHPSAVDHGDGQGKDLHGLVASLSDHEKQALKGILDKDVNGGMDVAKGNPSKQEHQKIAQASQEENETNAAEAAEQDPRLGVGEEQSDEIAKSMLDSRHMRGMATEKPRNLGERMKQSLASKLKSKGKI